MYALVIHSTRYT